MRPIKKKKSRKRPPPDPTRPLPVPKSLQDGYGFLVEIPANMVPVLKCPCGAILIRLKNYWACQECLGSSKLLRDEVVEEFAMKLGLDKVKAQKLVKLLVRRSKFEVKFEVHNRRIVEGEYG